MRRGSVLREKPVVAQAQRTTRLPWAKDVRMLMNLLVPEVCPSPPSTRPRISPVALAGVSNVTGHAASVFPLHLAEEKKLRKWPIQEVLV